MARKKYKKKTREPRGRADLSRPLFYEFPFPPSVNGYWRHFRGHFIVSPRGKAYKAGIVAATPDVPCVRDPCILIATFHPPTLQARDLDNYPKGLLDAMKDCGIIEDDVLIREMHTRWGSVVKGGLVSLSLHRYNCEIWNRLFASQ